VLALCPDGLDVRRRASGCFVLERGSSEAVVIHGSGELGWSMDRPDIGAYVRSDHEGRWAVESFSSPPLPEE